MPLSPHTKPPSPSRMFPCKQVDWSLLLPTPPSPHARAGMCRWGIISGQLDGHSEVMVPCAVTSSLAWGSRPSLTRPAPTPGVATAGTVAGLQFTFVHSLGAALRTPSRRESCQRRQEVLSSALGGKMPICLQNLTYLFTKVLPLRALDGWYRFFSAARST